MKKRLTINEVQLRRSIKPNCWYGVVMGHGIEFEGITGWRSPRIKKWIARYANEGTLGRGIKILDERTLKDCVFETQLHLLPDRKRDIE